MSHHANLLRIKSVYNSLQHFKNQVVFVGGATVSLYAERATEEVRPTDDVDILIELLTHKEYAAIEEQLRKMGFENDIISGVVCRYKVQGITVDVMPTGENVLGFSNRWYSDGFKNAALYKIDDHHTVRIFTAPYFIASKLEAFINRGKNDGRTSSDFEDIVFVLENRSSIWDELRHAPADVQEYLKITYLRFMQSSALYEWIHAHAGYGNPPATSYIMGQLKAFVNNEPSTLS